MDDGVSQGWWGDLAVTLSRCYNAPSANVGRQFVVALVKDMCGVRDRLCNSKWFIVFHMVILQRARHVTVYHAIRRSI